MLKIFTVFFWCASILRTEGMVKIFGVGKTGGNADVQKGIISEQQKLAGLFTTDFGNILLKGDSKVFFEKMRQIGQTQFLLFGDIGQQEFLCVIDVDVFCNGTDAGISVAL